MKHAIAKLRKSYLNIGFLKFGKIQPEDQAGTKLLDIYESNGDAISSAKYLSPELTSMHVMEDSILLYYKNKSRLEVFDGSGKMVKKVCIENKFVHVLNSSQTHLLVCYSEIDGGEIRLAVFDSELKLLCDKSIEFLVNPKSDDVDKKRRGKRPVKIFVENTRVYLLLIDLDLRQPVVFAFNLAVDLLNSFYLDSSPCLDEKFACNYDYLGLYHVNQKLFVKQKSLYGTRMDVLDSINGECLDKLVINYFFGDFFVDATSSHLNFMVDGKLYTYDLACKSIQSVSCLNNGDTFVGKFCVSRDASEVNALFQG